MSEGVRSKLFPLFSFAARDSDSDGIEEESDLELLGSSQALRSCGVRTLTSRTQHSVAVAKVYASLPCLRDRTTLKTRTRSVVAVYCGCLGGWKVFSVFWSKRGCKMKTRDQVHGGRRWEQRRHGKCWKATAGRAYRAQTHTVEPTDSLEETVYEDGTHTAHRTREREGRDPQNSDCRATNGDGET